MCSPSYPTSSSGQGRCIANTPSWVPHSSHCFIRHTALSLLIYASSSATRQTVSSLKPGTHFNNVGIPTNQHRTDWPRCWICFPLARGFPVLTLHIWMGISMSVYCKGEIYMALEQKPGQGPRDRLVWKGLEVFVHLALSEKLSTSSCWWIWIQLYFWRPSCVRNKIEWSFLSCWWIGVSDLTELPKPFACSSLFLTLPLEMRDLRVSFRGGRRRENAFPHS